MESTTTTITCSGIGQPANNPTPSLTYVADGYLWLVGADSVECLAALPDRLASMAYTWGPAGDKILFADGSILGSGIERGAITDVAASLGWTRPTGTSTIHVESNGTLTKTTSETTFGETRLTPLVHHDSVAYHPDGTTFAVSGTSDGDQGIWISKNDGSQAQLFASSDAGVVVSEMVFTNDARWLIAVANHTDDDFDDGYHLHSAFTEPFALDDGTMALASGAEFGANTHLESLVPLDSIVVAPDGGGLTDLPSGIALAQGACGTDRRAIYIPDGTISDKPVVLSEQPSYPVGFLFSSNGEHRIIVATSDDGCTGPFDWAEIIVNTNNLTTLGMSGMGVDALAVQAIAPTVDFTLSGVTIDPFA